MKSRRSFLATAAAAALVTVMPSLARAQNAVADWSLHAQNAIVPGRAAGSSEVLLAIVHAAMYDAVVAIEGGSAPFAVAVPVEGPASSSAAAAAAAYHVLKARVPAREAELAALYAAYLAGIPEGPEKANGIAAGEEAASGMLALRANDGLDATVPYVQPIPGAGVWEPTAASEPVDVKLGLVRPLALPWASLFRPDGPDALTSRRYARDVAEVREVGRADSTVRTAQQTELARFWAENPAVQWNRNLRALAAARSLDIAQTARLLAMVHVTTADAVIGCFDAKYWYLSWRPVHAIQRADLDGNPRTEPDPSWSSLLNVNHPEYPSGHGCWTEAVTEALRGYFGTDDIVFSLDSTVTGTTRAYARFADTSAEVQDARVYAGLHLRNSMVEGARLGRQVARYVKRRFFRKTRAGGAALDQDVLP